MVPDPTPDELYEEPPRTVWRDVVGVIVALVLLVVVGVVGYYWLMPDREVSDLWLAVTLKGTQADAPAPPPATQTPVVQHLRCDYCGMFADQSASHVVVQWENAGQTHHDCWDCAFKYGAENGLTLASAMVGSYDSPIEDPEWLEADKAYYLYDVKMVEGSMPPFVAAFADESSALLAQNDLGGQLVDFDLLKEKWQ